MKILFFVEPLIEMEKPYWKHSWANAFSLNIFNTIQKSDKKNIFDFCIAMNEPLGQIFDNSVKIKKVIFTQKELLGGPFKDRNYLDASILWYKQTFTDDDMRYYKKLMAGKFSGFTPDIIITYAPSPYLKAAFPNALILHKEYSIFSRKPFPESWYLDPVGMLEHDFLNKFKKQLQDFRINQKEMVLTKAFKKRVVRILSDKSPYDKLINPLRKRFKYLVLLPVQFSKYYAFDGIVNFKSQYDFISYVLENVPEEVGVIAPTHPDYNILTAGVKKYLSSKYKNFIYFDKFENYYSPSQFLLKYVDAVMSVSSSVALQTLFWDKKLIDLSDRFSFIADTKGAENTLKALSRSSRDKTNILFWLLTRYALTRDYIDNPEWLCEFLGRSLKRFRGEGINFNFYDPINNPGVIFDRLSKLLDGKNIPQVSSNFSYDRMKYVYFKDIKIKNDFKVLVGKKDEIIKQKELKIKQVIKQKEAELFHKNNELNDRKKDLQSKDYELSSRTREVNFLKESLKKTVEKIKVFQKKLIPMGEILQSAIDKSVPVEILLACADFCKLSDNFKSAQIFYKKAIELDTTPNSMVGYISLLLKQGLLKEASNILITAKQRFPKNAKVIDAFNTFKEKAQNAALHQEDEGLVNKKAISMSQAQEIIKVIFNPEFYARTYGLSIKENLLEHYIKDGARKGFWPSPLFDVQFYLKQIDEIKDAKNNPLLHYVLYGAGMMLNPHPLFDAKYYCSQNKKYLDSIKINPLYHYLAKGAKNNVDPHPMFDTDYYKVRYLQDSKEVINPLLHFVTIGWKKSYNPNPLFNIKSYQKENKLENKDINPLIHYIYNYSHKIDSLIYENFYPLFETVLKHYFTDDLISGQKDIKVAFSLVVNKYKSQGISLWKLYDTLTYLQPEETKSVNPPVLPELKGKKKLRVLYITGMFPSASHAGGLRLADILFELTKRHEVDLYSVYHRLHDEKYLSEFQKCIKHMRLISNDNLEIEDIQRWLKRQNKDIRYYDIIQCEYPNTIPLIPKLKKLGKRVGFTYMECMAKRYAIDYCLNLDKKTELGDILVKFLSSAKAEKFAAAHSDFSIAVTTEDQQYVAKFQKHIPYVISTGVTKSIFHKPLNKEEELYSAAFIGYFGHTPNIEAMQWYLRKIHPIVKRKVPKYRMAIIGGGDCSQLIDIAENDKSVIFTGFVEDITDYLVKAKICISPLISGAGFRGKINQYSALYRPSVATSIGLCGTPYVHNDSVLRADDAQDFAECIIRLLTDKQLYAKISQNCRKVVDKNFNWDNQIKKIEAVYTDEILG